MNISNRITVLLLSTILLLSCGSHRDNEHDSNRETNESATNPASPTESMVLEHLKKLDTESSLRVIQDGRCMVAEIFGAEWGVNILETDGRISTMTLITSKTDKGVFLQALERLTLTLGAPYILDKIEDRAKWYDSHMDTTLRHLHTDEGGWTIYVNYRE